MGSGHIGTEELVWNIIHSAERLCRLTVVDRAQICRAKAIDWKTRNPVNPAHLQLRLESLKRMKQAYQVYEEVHYPCSLHGLSFELC